ncbi:MAG: hypothetical protein KAV87_25635 [Desulfobacteraceae bacterium]|nr:hypothetical protein [Desulfobacteraceae bacterium]
MLKLLQQIVNAFVHKESLHYIKMEKLVDIFFPIAISIILGTLIKGVIADSWLQGHRFLGITRILIGVFLIVYILYDWDDCHRVPILDVSTHTGQKLLYIFALSWLSYTACLILHKDFSKSVPAVLCWLSYSVLVTLARDPVISVALDQALEAPLTKVREYTSKDKHIGSYEAYNKVFWISCATFFVLGACCTTEMFDFREQLHITPNTNVTLHVAHVGFLLSLTASILLKNMRKLRVLIPVSDRLERTQA